MHTQMIKELNNECYQRCKQQQIKNKSKTLILKKAKDTKIQKNKQLINNTNNEDTG